jgi:hypothetical protein
MIQPDHRIRTLRLRLVNWQLALHEELLLFLACDSSSEGDHIVNTVKENRYKYKYTYIYTDIQTVYIHTYIHTYTHNIIYEELLINKSSDKVNLTV